jgi:hypothetical protein
VAEIVHQNDAAPLAGRQTHEGSQAGFRRLALREFVHGIFDHFERLILDMGGVAGPSAEKIHGSIVGNAE